MEMELKHWVFGAIVAVVVWYYGGHSVHHNSVRRAEQSVDMGSSTNGRTSGHDIYDHNAQTTSSGIPSQPSTPYGYSNDTVAVPAPAILPPPTIAPTDPGMSASQRAMEVQRLDEKIRDEDSHLKFAKENAEAHPDSLSAQEMYRSQKQYSGQLNHDRDSAASGSYPYD